MATRNKKAVGAKKAGSVVKATKSAAAATADGGTAPAVKARAARKSGAKGNGVVARSRSGGTALVIVESPTKAKTIGKYLGSGYDVKATVGHVRDLPTRELGVDLENGVEPQ